MKKTLSIILAVMMLLGLSATAFADSTTTIKATKEEPAPVTYEIVVPTEIPTIIEAGVYEIGRASVEDVENYTDNTFITYTVSGTNFINDDGSGKEIPATYYYNEGWMEWPAEMAVPVCVPDFMSAVSTPEVMNAYKLYVGIDGTDWETAEYGDYTATVTYNFKAEEVWMMQDILDTAEGDFPHDESHIRIVNNAWVNSEDNTLTAFTFDEGVKTLQLGENCLLPTMNPVAKENGNYVLRNAGMTVTFNMSGGVLQSIVLYGSEGAGYYGNNDGTYAPPVN